MKKILLGTTAIIALSTFSAEAFAAEKIKLGLGGFMRHYVGLTNSDEVAATALSSTTRAMDLGQFSNTEIYFTGSTTLDNGLNVSAKVQKEADKAATTIDETSLTVSSDAMGALTVGGTAHAGDDYRVSAPNAGEFDHGDFAAWTSTSIAAGTDTTGVSATAGDITDMGGKAVKLKYASPSFSGVNVFASYSAGEGSGAHNARNLTRNAAHDGSTIGAAFGGEVGGASVDASIINLKVNGTNDANHYGLSVGMAGFTVGGSYATMDDDSGSNAADGKAYELGVAYETGPYSMSARYMNAKSDGTATAGDNKDVIWSLAATYDMGAGVGLSATYFDTSFDAEGTTASVDTSGIIAGIEVGF